MTTITAISRISNLEFTSSGSEDMVLLSQQVESIIPTPEALYAILDEDDAIKITEVSLHSIREGAWTIESSTYRFELNVDVRHIGTISDSAVAKISDAIFKNASVDA